MASSSEILQIPHRALRQTSHIARGMNPIVNSQYTGRLAVISHGKLRQESLSQTPDLRRCIGHHGIFRQCVIAEQEQHERRYKALSVEEDTPRDVSNVSASTESEQSIPSAPPPIRSQITRAVKAMTQRRFASAPKTPKNEQQRDMADCAAHKSHLIIRTRERAFRLFPGRSRRIAPTPVLF